MTQQLLGFTVSLLLAHRNRWFTLKNGDFPWQTVSHNQMVSVNPRPNRKAQGTLHGGKSQLAVTWDGWDSQVLQL